MAITLQDAKDHLDITDTTDDIELTFFVAAANKWMATQIADEDLNEEPVQLATRELVDHWWESQRGGALESLNPDTGVGLLGFAIPNRVKEKIAPYILTDVPPPPRGSFPDPADWPDPTQW